MRALHLCQIRYDNIDTPRSSGPFLELSMSGSHGNQLIDTVAAVGYWQAGLWVGLAQGYAYAAAEACHALGFTALEGQLRRVLPRTAVDEATATPSVVSNARGDRVVTASIAGPSSLPSSPVHQAAWQPDTPADTGNFQNLCSSTAGTTAAVKGHERAPAPPALQAWPQVPLPSPAQQGTSSSSYLADAPAAPRTPAAVLSASAAPAPATTAAALALEAATTAAAAAAPAAAATAAAAKTTAGSTSDLDPNAVEFVPLTGDFEPGRFCQIPTSAIDPQQLQLQDLTHQSMIQEGQHAVQDDLHQQDLSAVVELDRRLSSFALDHISPTTTATTLAMAPASFVQYDDEDGDADGTGMDVGVGPLEPVEGELDIPITNSTGSNLLPPLGSSSNGGLAATAAAAAAALAARFTAPQDSDIGYLDTGSAHSRSGEYKIGLPAQRSTVSSNASSPNVSAQFNACFTAPPAYKPNPQQQQGVMSGLARRSAGQYSSSSTGHTISGPSDQTQAQDAVGGSSSHKGKATHVKFAEPGTVIDTINRGDKAVPSTAGAFASASQGVVPIERQGSVASSDTSADVGDQKKRVGLIGRLRRQFSGRRSQDS